MSYTKKEDILKLGDIDPEFDRHFRSLNVPKDEHSTVEERKALSSRLMQNLAKRLAEPESGISKTRVPYMTSDGAEMQAYLFQPDPLPKDGSPMIMIIHGGGFVVGGPESEELTCRHLVRAFGAVCYCISYRLAPEYKFPTAPEDCWDALKFVAGMTKPWGADPLKKGFVVGGVSAGGNIAAGLAHRARDERLYPPLTGQWLACAWLCSPETLPSAYRDRFYSYDQNYSAPGLNHTTLLMYRNAYMPELEDDRFNILCHSAGHNSLPPAYFQVCGMDPFRDEDLVYESILRNECGIATKLDVYPGLPHGFWIFFPGLTNHVNRFRQNLVEGFRWLLTKTETEVE